MAPLSWSEGNMTDWPIGGGEMAHRIRTHDWASTPLGALDSWPQSRRTAVELMLASGHAMQMAWGPERIVLYNDAYAPMLGDRHPSALGAPFGVAWPEIWADIEPLVERVFAGETLRFEEMHLVMTRHGAPEDTWWDFSYSPVRDEAGGVAALLNVTQEASAQRRTAKAERERDEANRQRTEYAAGFRALVTTGANSVYRMSPDWREMYQLDSQTLANTTAPVEDWVDKYIPPEDLPEVSKAIQKAIRTKTPFEFEHRVRLAGGAVGWVFSRAVPMVGPDGEIAEWFGVATDVTQRREAAEHLHRSEERHRELFAQAERKAAELRAVIESMGDAVYVGDEQGIHLANRSALDQLGYSSYQELARRIGVLAQEIQTRDAVTGEVIVEADQPFARALGGERVVRNVRVRHLVTGEERTVRSSASPVVIGGLVTGAVAVNTDITGVARTEAALRESEDRQKFLLSLSDALRTIADPGDIKKIATTLLGERLAVNRALYADANNGYWLVAEGFERGIIPLPRQPFAMSDYGDWIVVNFQAGEPLIVEDMSSDARFSAAERDAHLALDIRAEVVLPLVKNARLVAILALQSGVPRAWSTRDIGLLQDAAERIWNAIERARAEAELHLADRRKDEFLAVLAHELRNGLAPLVYNAEIANKGIGDAAVLKQLFVRSGRQLQHIVHLVDDLLDVARITTGKIQLNPELLNVRDVVNAALDVCRPDIDRKHHRVTLMDEAEADLRVLVDKVRLTQVISNLLSNATKYMDSGGTITVRIAREAEQALIEIRDTGIGIPADALPKVFDMFTQVRNQQGYSAGGLGIGLSLVKQLVEAQGGAVTAASEGPGRGSTFLVRLPIVAAHSDSAATDRGPPSREAPHQPLRVLVVDDQRDSADALAQLLRLHGHDAEPAYGGQDALERASAYRPDLVLLDLGMPGLDGFEVARRLRKELADRPTMQIVALTGWGQEPDRQRTKAAGFDGHLAKPATGADLEAVLASAAKSLC